MKILAGNIRRLRRDTGISHEELAEISGLHAKHIQRFEAGVPNTTVATMTAIAFGLGVNIKMLFKKSGSRK